MSHTQSGYVAIVGRPNVGKSTLMNRILGQKLSITSRKPQTTRHQIMGIKTEDNVQTIYVDTPGLHQKQPKAINRFMNKAAMAAYKDVDVIIMLVDRLKWSEDDENVLSKLQQTSIPIILAVNKIDSLADKQQLLPALSELQSRHNFAEIIPISAKSGHNVAQLEALLCQFLPVCEFHYPEDALTNRSSRFLAAELIREKIMRQLGDELPYAMTVEIEKFTDKPALIEIHALIYVERDSQKSIVIGERGARLKQIGIEARKDMQALFAKKIMLHTWVKTRSGWADSEKDLKSFGFDKF